MRYCYNKNPSVATPNWNRMWQWHTLTLNDFPLFDMGREHVYDHSIAFSKCSTHLTITETGDLKVKWIGTDENYIALCTFDSQPTIYIQQSIIIITNEQNDNINFGDISRESYGGLVSMHSFHSIHKLCMHNTCFT